MIVQYRHEDLGSREPVAVVYAFVVSSIKEKSYGTSWISVMRLNVYLGNDFTKEAYVTLKDNYPI